MPTLKTQPEIKIVKMRRPPDILTIALILLLFSWSWCGLAQEERLPTHILLQGGSYSFVSQTSRGSSEVSGFGAYSASLGIGLFSRFMFYGSISLLVSDGFSGDTATGYDLGMKYYWNSSTGRNVYSHPNMTFNLITRLRPYVGLVLRQRQFTEVLSSSYIGPGVSLGADYQIQGNWYLNGEVSYGAMQGNADNTLNTMNVVFGLGLQL